MSSPSITKGKESAVPAAETGITPEKAVNDTAEAASAEMNLLNLHFMMIHPPKYSNTTSRAGRNARVPRQTNKLVSRHESRRVRDNILIYISLLLYRNHHAEYKASTEFRTFREIGAETLSANV
jgi:hypothetical protein